MYGFAQKYAPITMHETWIRTSPTTMTFEEVTPERAKEWLAFPSRNRKLRKQHIDHLALEIANDRWNPFERAIDFSSEPALLNGQHRLHAIVKANKSVLMWVQRDVPVETFFVFDRGKGRTVADALHVEGYDSADQLAAMVRLIIGFTRPAVAGAAALQASVSPAEVSKFLSEHSDMAGSLHIIALAKRHKLLQPSLAGALHWLFAHSPTGSAEQATSFFERLLRGTGIDRFDSIYHLRRRYEMAKSPKHKLAPPETAALCIKAWNKRNESTTMIRWISSGQKPEDFPLIQ